MASATTIDDEVLGTLTWDEAQMMWTFEAGPIAGRSIRGAVLPKDPRHPLTGVQLDPVRTCIQWIRGNEYAVREHLTAELFEWWRKTYTQEVDSAVGTPENFCARIALACICFLRGGGKAMAVYDGAGLFGGQTIWVTIGPGGSFDGLEFRPGKRSDGLRQPITFRELVDTFWGWRDVLREVLCGERWRRDYLDLLERYSDPTKPDRARFDAQVPIELSREVAAQCPHRFGYDASSLYLHWTPEAVHPGDTPLVEMSALEVHDRFGGSLIGEIWDKGSAPVPAPA
jgi:hypothetical protein